MAWYDDTDALAIVRELQAQMATEHKRKNGYVYVLADMWDQAEYWLAQLADILEKDSLTCTCATRTRGRSADEICDT